MRPPRADSPNLKRQVTRTESLRQRCNDKNTDEIIRFVRDIQFERLPTSMRLQKKAPLPSIGQNCIKSNTCDSGFLDRATDSADSDEDMLDNEILYSTQKKSAPKLDPVLINMLTCPRGVTKTSNDHQILSRSLPQGHADMYNNNLKVPRQNSFIRHGKIHRKGNTGNQRIISKQLPPLSRDIIPERPSAPPPSKTPPLSDNSFVEEEPLEYLDL
ncbi:uncharacterized protein LOC123545444 isoform X2 [Mercenaria mercenaria]|nr:uncharacterized protein LOC123545444 isoform X2 [Mercenaria mercenaria]XP_045187698.1 uncharacterized protein LOC123545444 isoform X2 [Mercenaria mercenaria]XP_045187699.1 uncharacterized protein LOC123545444 isoform X2 [Mercenaria mercenaria]